MSSFLRLPTTKVRDDAGVLVVGGGYLGSAIARLVGPSVTVVRRDATPRPTRPLPAGARLVGLDLSTGEPEDVRRAFAHLAAERPVVATLARPQGSDARFYPMAARRLAEALPDHTTRLVWISSTSACPDVDGPVDEHTTGPVGPRGRMQRAAEEAVRTICSHRGIPWVIVRLGGLYGPSRPIGGWWTRRGPGAVVPGHGWIATNLVHLADAARIVLAAAREPRAEGRTLLAVAPDHTPRRLAYARAACARGEPPPRFEAPIPTDRRVRGKRVDGSHTATLLKYRFLHPVHAYGLR